MLSNYQIWYLDNETRKELTKQLKSFIRTKIHMIRNQSLVSVEEVYEISRYTLAESFLKRENPFVISIKQQAEVKGVNDYKLLEDIEAKLDLLIPQQYHVARVKLKSITSGESFLELIKEDQYKGIQTIDGMKFMFEENYDIEKSFIRYVESLRNQKEILKNETY